MEHALDIRYVGQEYTLTIPLAGADEPLDEDFDTHLADRFHAAHELRFGHANPGAFVELVVVRTTALGDLGRAAPARQQEVDEHDLPEETRAVVFGREAVPTTIARRDDLVPGMVLEGPAVVEEATATTVVPPGATLRVDPFGALVITATSEDS